eukprot:CFRG8090T1
MVASSSKLQSPAISIIDARCEHTKRLLPREGLDRGTRARLDHYAHLYTKSKKRWIKRIAMVTEIDNYIIASRKTWLEKLESDLKNFKGQLKGLDSELRSDVEQKVKEKKKEYRKLKRVMSKADRSATVESFRHQLEKESENQFKITVYRFYLKTLERENELLCHQREKVNEMVLRVKEADERTIQEQHDVQRKELQCNLEYILKKEIKRVSKKTKRLPKHDRELGEFQAVEKAKENHAVIAKDVVSVMRKRQKNEVDGMAEVYKKVASLIVVFYEKQSKEMSKLIVRAKRKLFELGDTPEPAVATKPNVAKKADSVSSTTTQCVNVVDCGVQNDENDERGRSSLVSGSALPLASPPPSPTSHTDSNVKATDNVDGGVSYQSSIYPTIDHSRQCAGGNMDSISSHAAHYNSRHQRLFKEDDAQAGFNFNHNPANSSASALYPSLSEPNIVGSVQRTSGYYSNTSYPEVPLSYYGTADFSLHGSDSPSAPILDSADLAFNTLSHVDSTATVSVLYPCHVYESEVSAHMSAPQIFNLNTLPAYETVTAQQFSALDEKRHGTSSHSHIQCDDQSYTHSRTCSYPSVLPVSTVAEIASDENSCVRSCTSVLPISSCPEIPIDETSGVSSYPSVLSASSTEEHSNGSSHPPVLSTLTFPEVTTEEPSRGSSHPPVLSTPTFPEVPTEASSRGSSQPVFSTPTLPEVPNDEASRCSSHASVSTFPEVPTHEPSLVYPEVPTHDPSTRRTPPAIIPRPPQSRTPPLATIQPTHTYPSM